MVDAPGGDMGAVMREASKIKTAQLKQRPGRQLWEEAPEWFKGGTLKRPRSGGAGGASGDGDHSFEERHSRAMSLKREGNDAFGNGNLELALACYVRSAAEWAWFEQRGEDMPLVRSYADIEDEEQRNRAVDTLCAALCNAAQCRLKETDARGALYCARSAMRANSAHVKAMYRGAQAHLMLGSGYDLEEATRLLTLGAKLEPNNFEVQRSLRRARRSLAEQNTRDRETFGSMFERPGELYEGGERVGASEGSQSAGTSSAPGGDEPAVASATAPTPRDAAIAKELGIDPRDPRMAFVKRRLDEERRRRDQEIADKMGLDLSDPMVQREMARIEEEVRLEKDKQRRRGEAIKAGGMQAARAHAAGALERAARSIDGALRYLLPHTRSLSGTPAYVMWALHGLMLAHVARTIWHVLYARPGPSLPAAYARLAGAEDDDAYYN